MCARTDRSSQQYTPQAATPSMSEEDAHRPISELHVSPSVTPETGGHQNVTG